MVRAGLIISLRGGWQGGVNYVRNLLSCYQKYPDPAVRLEVFTAHPEDATGYQCDAIGVHSWPQQIPHTLRNFPRRVARRILGYDPSALKALKRQKVDVLSHFSLGGQTRINTLTWQPDFQHKRLPEFFSPEECALRDAVVGGVERWGNILLSSQAAAGDFRRFYPQLASVQTHVLHFSSGAILDVEPRGHKELATQYPVSEPYFFLPNQFWKHKNHSVVIEALRQSPPEVRVICTGSMDDHRHPDYVPELLERVKQAGLQKRFVCLGTVDYAALVSLMHHSVAVVQPSLFEGWSTSVEESKAMRKQIILSNIDVHLEQAPERGVYFSPDSPEELSACLQRAYSRFDPSVEQRFAEQRLILKPTIERGWIGDFSRIIKAVSGNGN